MHLLHFLEGRSRIQSGGTDGVLSKASLFLVKFPDSLLFWSHSTNSWILVPSQRLLEPWKTMFKELHDQSKASFSGYERNLNLTLRRRCCWVKTAVRLGNSKRPEAMAHSRRLWTHPSPRCLPQKKLAWIDKCYRWSLGFMSSAWVPSLSEGIRQSDEP